jgi:hypothetical protein
MLKDLHLAAVSELQPLKRFEAEGVSAYAPRSRRPHTSPHAVGASMEDQIIRLPKELSKHGLDAGAETIRVHLLRDPSNNQVPAVATIWRILSAAVLSPRNRTSGPAQAASGSRHCNPTNAGRQTSPTGDAPKSGRSAAPGRPRFASGPRPAPM